MNELTAHLARASLAGGAFVAAVWLLCRLAPRLSPGVRAGLWWAASLKLLVALVWIAPFELALLPAPVAPASSPPGETGAIAVPGTPRAGGIVRSASGGPVVTPSVTRTAAAPAPAPRPLPWREGLALAWLAGVAFGGVRMARDLATVRRLRRTSRPAADPALQALFRRVRERLGISRPVELRLTGVAPSPLTVGVRKPAVLLPTPGLDRLPTKELEMAICHELLHVRRRDLWTGWVPQIAKHLFFFHPLAALAAREHTLAREAACDAAVLRELGMSAGSYGRLLLRWSARRGSAGRRAPLPEIAVAAGASSSFVHLKRRLEMLQRSSSPSRAMKLVGGAVALAAVVALAPIRIVAHPPEPPDPPKAPAPPEAPAPPAPPAASTTVVAPTPPAPPVAPVASAPRAPAAPRVAPAAPEPPKPPERGYSYAWSDDGEAWALIGPGAEIWLGDGLMDRERVRELRRDGEPLIWFLRDGRQYVIRDRATIERFDEILGPQQELGRRQGELGARQGELGSQQGELGRRQGELGAQQGELRGRQATLAERQRELAERQRALGERQRELAERQAALAGQQREAAEEARPKIRALLDRAIADGVAEEVRP